MLSYDEALKAIIENCQPLESETVHLSSSLRRVIAAPMKASFDMPQFNNSAVDGFGVLVEDLIGATAENPKKLKIVGEVAAGGSWRSIESPTESDTNTNGAQQSNSSSTQQSNSSSAQQSNTSSPQLHPGQCIRILTGAPVPGTVEAIVMKEFCTQDLPDSILVTTSTRIGENIRLQGEEIEEGATVLQPGTQITPPVLGVIASLGITEITAYRSPKVAVIATGDELIEPGEQLAEGQIYNSNSFALVAALNALGVYDVKRFHTRDNREETTKILAEALAFADIIIAAGGVSVGEYDIVKDVCEELGVQTVFWRIAIKPGKPVYFGKLKSESANKLVFGLPGNPVSALVTFNLFVKPAIARLQGRSASKRQFQAKAARNLKKKAGRLDFVRGNLSPDNQEAKPTGAQESHMLTGLAKADCLMHFDKDLEFLPEGDLLKVELLNWFE